QYREIEAALPRYEFEPRRAGELLQELGYTKGSNGMYRDGAGQSLEVDVRSGPAETEAKTAATVADSWQRLGVATTTGRTSPQRLQDFEYTATFPAFSLWIRANDLNGLRGLYSSATPLPSTGFRGANTSRYMSAQLDALLDSYFTTLPLADRTEVLGNILNHVADQVTTVGLYYYP